MSGWWNTLRVTPGKRSGIAKDCAVLNPDGLVGRTLQVYASSADILLISDPAFRVAASVSTGILQVLFKAWVAHYKVAQELRSNL